jgi:hypothetical protein
VRSATQGHHITRSALRTPPFIQVATNQTNSPTPLLILLTLNSHFADDPLLYSPCTLKMHSPAQTKTLKTPTNCPSVSREDGACWSHDDITPRAANIHLKVPPRRLYLGALSPSTLPNAADEEEEMGEGGTFSLLSKQGLCRYLRDTAKSTVQDQIRLGALVGAIDKACASSTWLPSTVDEDYACAVLVITGQSTLHHLVCFSRVFAKRTRVSRACVASAPFALHACTFFAKTCCSLSMRIHPCELKS